MAEQPEDHEDMGELEGVEEEYYEEEVEGGSSMQTALEILNGKTNMNSDEWNVLEQGIPPKKPKNSRLLSFKCRCTAPDVKRWKKEGKGKDLCTFLCKNITKATDHENSWGLCEEHYETVYMSDDFFTDDGRAEYILNADTMTKPDFENYQEGKRKEISGIFMLSYEGMAASVVTNAVQSVKEGYDARAKQSVEHIQSFERLKIDTVQSAMNAEQLGAQLTNTLRLGASPKTPAHSTQRRSLLPGGNSWYFVW